MGAHDAEFGAVTVLARVGPLLDLELVLAVYGAPETSHAPGHVLHHALGIVILDVFDVGRLLGVVRNRSSLGVVPVRYAMVPTLEKPS